MSNQGRLIRRWSGWWMAAGGILLIVYLAGCSSQVAQTGSPALPVQALAASPTPAPTPTPTPPPIFDGDRAYEHVLAQVEIGPRPTGSEKGWATGDFIIGQLEQAGWVVASEEFTFQGVKGRNIIGKAGSGPVVILGAHYDTRPAADKDPDPAKQSGEKIVIEE